VTSPQALKRYVTFVEASNHSHIRFFTDIFHKLIILFALIAPVGVFALSYIKLGLKACLGFVKIKICDLIYRKEEVMSIKTHKLQPDKSTWSLETWLTYKLPMEQFGHIISLFKDLLVLAKADVKVTFGLFII
jgi:hypothetical protein